MRDWPWREVKVGLVARGEHFVQNKGRGLVTQARFVARLGDYDGFKRALTDVLTLERAWECPHLVVIGDGAPWVWTLADEVCHGATQILDYPHALEHATEAAQVIATLASPRRPLLYGAAKTAIGTPRVTIGMPIALETLGTSALSGESASDSGVVRRSGAT